MTLSAHFPIGGYDPRMAENVSYLKELQGIATGFNLKHETFQGISELASPRPDTQVLFLPSVSDKVKQSLLDTATLLIYTPRHEHFGIVPLEAMLNEVPVLAADEGGPVETVVNDLTGWLRSVADEKSWAEVMQLVVRMQRTDPAKLMDMGKAGRKRVQDKFSKQEMAVRLDDILDRLRTSKRPAVINNTLVNVIGLVIVAIVVGIAMSKLLFHALAQDAAYQKKATGI